MCGIQTDHSIKTQQSSLIWGVYLKPDWRSARIASHLIEACVD
jgi:hypothetical protein